MRGTCPRRTTFPAGTSGGGADGTAAVGVACNGYTSLRDKEFSWESGPTGTAASTSAAADGRWYGAATVVESGQRRRRTVSGSTRAEVLVRLTELRAQARAGVTMPRDTPLERYLSDWLQRRQFDVGAGNLQPSTLRSYAEHVHTWIAPTIGSLPLVGLTTDDVRDLLAALKVAGRAAGTQARVHATLRKGSPMPLPRA